MQNDENNKDAVLASTNTVENNASSEANVSTIKAADLKDNITTTNKRDISAIIPQKAMQGEEVEGTLQSKENLLKGDGSIVIGNIENDQLKLTPDAKIPEKIDIAQRKKDQLEALKAKKSSSNKNIIFNQAEKIKKNQTKYSLLAILLMAIVGVGFYVWKNMKTDMDFSVKNLTLELGDKIPVHSEDYVIPGIEGVVDDLLYSINTSEVLIDEVGEYDYYVTYKNVTKKGTITIQDTTPPEVVTKDVTIIEGQDYTAGIFVEKCHDLSGYELKFKSEEYGTYTTPGEYDNIVIVASDAYNNITEKTVKLTIKNKGIVQKYEKANQDFFTEGYSLTTRYELYFSDYASDNILYYANLIEEYKYFDDNLYNLEKEKHIDDQEYTFNDDNIEIVRNARVETIGRGLSDKDSIIDYLINQGFTKVE